VHGAAVHGMRMADQRGVRGVRRAGIQQRLESASGAVEKE
jgi:hypothetical protein